MEHLFHWLVDSLFVFAIWYILALLVRSSIQLSPTNRYIAIVFIQAAACIHWILTFYYPLSLPNIALLDINANTLLPYFIGTYVSIAFLLISLDLYQLNHLQKSIYTYQRYPSSINIAIQKIQLYSPEFSQTFIRFTTKSLQPFVFGFVQPIIVLPLAIINQLPYTTIEWILLHEWMHIKHYDLYIHQLAKVISRILFFNPFFHAINSIREQLMEEKCDAWVLHYKNQPLEYSTALLELAKLHNTQHYPAFSSKESLLKRIQLINGHQSFSNKLNWNPFISGAILMLFFLLFQNNPVATMKLATISEAEIQETLSKPINSFSPLNDNAPVVQSKKVKKTKRLTQAPNNEILDDIKTESFQANSFSNVPYRAIAVRDTSLGWVAQPLLKREPIEMETWIPIDYDKITVKRKKKDGSWEVWEILIPKNAANQKLQIEIPEEQ